MEKANIEIDFSYTDEFGQKTRMIKTYTEAVLMDQGHLEFLMGEFKNFLIAAGYLPEQVNKIQLLDE